MTISTPCNTWVDIDLSTVTFLNDGGGDPTGEFSDGVIWANGAGHPNYWFDFALDPTKAYTIEVTFDPTSLHDGGNRLVTFWAVRPLHEQEDFDPFNVAGLYSSAATVSADVGDVFTITIGPDIPRTDDHDPPLLTGTPDWNDPTGGVVAGWTRIFFENDIDAAVSTIRVMQICATTTVIPPLRQYPRSDGLGASTVRRLWPLPNTIQASNRRGPSAIL